MSKNVLGYELWRGASSLSGDEIVCIATGFKGSSNRKTGDMIQTYILRADTTPVEAIKQNKDYAICGDCVHRGSGHGKGRTCYVNVGQGPRSVYDAWKRGRYSTSWDAELFRDKIVRLGTYGDPAVIPLEIWNEVLKYARGNTGYTHQWHTEAGRSYASYCMASVDSEDERRSATGLGFRTFRVTPPREQGSNKLIKEVVCPASEEAGKKLTCAECLACSGTKRGQRSGIVIQAHGPAPVMKNMRERHANSITDVGVIAGTA